MPQPDRGGPLSCLAGALPRPTAMPPGAGISAKLARSPSASRAIAAARSGHDSGAGSKSRVASVQISLQNDADSARRGIVLLGLGLMQAVLALVWLLGSWPIGRWPAWRRRL